jgi:hypothetical protein
MFEHQWGKLNFNLNPDDFLEFREFSSNNPQLITATIV